MSPLISIILCTYNGERFIAEQLDSLLNQTWPHLEIIISDDCSTDGTRKILSSYSTYPQITIYFQDSNLGPVKNFEFAASKAKGDYIACCDQDDIWKPEKIEVLYNNLDDFPLIYSDSELISEGGIGIGKRLSQLRNMYSGVSTKGFVFDNVVWGHTLLVQKKLLQTALPIPSSIPHDIWFAYKATANGGIKYLDKVLTFYRQHTETHTKTLATPAIKRSHSKRYADFIKQLTWIEIMKDNAKNEERQFYTHLFDLYSLKKNGTFSWKLFLFLYQHQSEIFLFRKKSKISNLIEIFKISRGERI